MQLEQPGDAVYAARTIIEALPELTKDRREAAGAALYNIGMALLARGDPDDAKTVLELTIDRLSGTGAARSAREMLESKPRGETPPIESCVKRCTAEER